jgi:uracil-DNA glycosylase family 4
MLWHELWVDNIVRCWLPGNRPPTTAEVEHCWAAHGSVDLLEISPRVVVPVGLPAARKLYDAKVGEKDMGRPKWITS